MLLTNRQAITTIEISFSIRTCGRNNSNALYIVIGRALGTAIFL